MRTIAFWTEKLAKADAELTIICQRPRFKPSDIPPRRKIHRGRWRLARNKWERRMRAHLRWWERKRYLEARISYYRDRIDALTERGARILNSPVI